MAAEAAPLQRTQRSWTICAPRSCPAYHVRYPEMPNEERAHYKTWKRIIAEHVREMGAGAILVGHSIGASVLAKVMTDEPPLIRRRRFSHCRAILARARNLALGCGRAER